MKKIELLTPFGAWEISEVSETILNFKNKVYDSMSFTLECDANFPICSASSLTAFAKVHNHKFPNVEQLEILTLWMRLYLSLLCKRHYLQCLAKAK